jgi:hypothetical protein
MRGLVLAAALALSGCGDTSSDRQEGDAVSTTAVADVAEGFPDWPTERMITMTFDPDAATAAAVLEVTITNRSDIGWSFECRAGVLSRWDGEASDAIGSVIWRDDRLQVSEAVADPGCTTPASLLEPGATEVRTVRLGSTVDGDGRPLEVEPGAYQLLFPDREAFTGAVGQFVVTED